MCTSLSYNIYKHMCARTQTHVHTYTHSCMHTYIHTYIHAYIT